MKIRELPFASASMSKKGGFSVWRIRELLPGLSSMAQVEFVSADGEVVAVSGEEILDGEVYLALYSEVPAYRLLIPADAHRRRWCKNIVEISIEEGGC